MSRIREGRVSKIKIGPPYLTKYEKAAVIAARALQIEVGAPVLIRLPPGLIDPVKIARLELEKKALPLIIRRTIRGSLNYQDIPLEWLEIIN